MIKNKNPEGTPIDVDERVQLWISVGPMHGHEVRVDLGGQIVSNVVSV